MQTLVAKLAMFPAAAGTQIPECWPVCVIGCAVVPAMTMMRWRLVLCGMGKIPSKAGILGQALQALLD
jgi:hypothetical protein